MLEINKLYKVTKEGMGTLFTNSWRISDSILWLNDCIFVVQLHTRLKLPLGTYKIIHKNKVGYALLTDDDVSNVD